MNAMQSVLSSIAREDAYETNRRTIAVGRSFEGKREELYGTGLRGSSRDVCRVGTQAIFGKKSDEWLTREKKRG